VKTQLIPKRISLANIPTPIQKISFEGEPFFIKRDDLTGLETSGNKIRKLEYLLYQAKKEKADYVFTCGGEQSNHARATAFAAASLGIKANYSFGEVIPQMPKEIYFLIKFLVVNSGSFLKMNSETPTQ